MSPATLAPGPRGTLLLGNFRDFGRDQLGFYESCARGHGDLVRVRLGPRRLLLVFHPDAIEEVLATRSRDYVKSPGVRLLRSLLGDGLLLSEGEIWLRQRRLVQPAFHRQRLAEYARIMTAATERRLEGWTDGQVIDVNAEMLGLTQDIVARTLFGADVSRESAAIAQAVQVLMEDFSSRLHTLRLLPWWVPTPGNLRANRAIRDLDALVYRIIEGRRRSGEDRGDLLSMLLHAQDADDGSGMTDRQVRDEVMTLFMAGHETTAVALAWTWLLLGQQPAAEAGLGETLAAALDGRVPTAEDLPRLAYAEHVVSEAMRLYPPAYALGRQAIRRTAVAGHTLGRGVIVVVPTWVVHRDPRWFADPLAFRPERWADGLARRLPRYAYAPFGGGPRQCVGNAFAMMEAVLILVTIARRFRLVLEPDQRVTPVPYVTLRPEPGIRARLVRR